MIERLKAAQLQAELSELEDRADRLDYITVGMFEDLLKIVSTVIDRCTEPDLGDPGLNEQL